MLSKSQARLFFLVGTFLFSSVFLGLTWDTMRQMSKRTNAQNLSAEVKAGKHIWETNNCMGCHTLLGEGAYYAPDLTKIVKQKGKTYLKTFLTDPQAMYPGQRKMIQYNFTEEQKDNVLAFLEWVGNIDTNGWPPEPNIKPPATESTVSSKVSEPPPEKFAQLCTACHKLNGKGGVVGPALDGVGSKYDLAYLDKWIKDPQLVKPGTAMPQMPLTDAEREEIVTFLIKLK